jgi:hypothetical protein
MRAQSAAMSGGILGLEAAEATYFAASVDGNNQALGKGQAYRLHLPQGRLPADAFWSISLYEFVTGGQYMVDNPINRYSIGDRTKGMKFNADGSLDIWLQPTDPGPEKRANWLPTPEKNLFYLMARAYQPWPGCWILRGFWSRCNESTPNECSDGKHEKNISALRYAFVTALALGQLGTGTPTPTRMIAEALGSEKPRCACCPRPGVQGQSADGQVHHGRRWLWH